MPEKFNHPADPENISRLQEDPLENFLEKNKSGYADFKPDKPRGGGASGTTDEFDPKKEDIAA